MIATFQQPFDILTETAAVAARRDAATMANSEKTEIWLGDLDSNQGCPVQSRKFYR